MLAHHICTLGLVLSSYSLGLTRIGALGAWHDCGAGCGGVAEHRCMQARPWPLASCASCARSHQGLPRVSVQFTLSLLCLLRLLCCRRGAGALPLQRVQPLPPHRQGKSRQQSCRLNLKVPPVPLLKSGSQILFPCTSACSTPKVPDSRMTNEHLSCPLHLGRQPAQPAGPHAGLRHLCAGLLCHPSHPGAPLHPAGDPGGRLVSDAISNPLLNCY